MSRALHRFAFLALALAVFASADARAAVPAAALRIHTQVLPTNFSSARNVACEGAEGGEEKVLNCDVIRITVTNEGDARSFGPTLITDQLPASLTSQAVTSLLMGVDHEHEGEPSMTCNLPASQIECSFETGLRPGQFLELNLAVTVAPGGSSEPNLARVLEAGEALSDSAGTLVPISDALPPFGPAGLLITVPGLGGEPETQAGGHPNSFTTRFEMNSIFRRGPESQGFEALGVEDLRDAVVDLPLGFLGSAEATPKCTFAQLNGNAAAGGGCPANTRVGRIITRPRGFITVNSYVYNMVPEPGVAAEFGFEDVLHNSHLIFSSILSTPRGYVLRAASDVISQLSISNVFVTFYGDPASKNAELRQEEIEEELREQGIEFPFVEREIVANRVAMFTNPSQCSGQPLTTTINTDSWQHPGRRSPDGSADPADPSWASRSSSTPAVSGCNKLSFNPRLIASIDTPQADSPAGLDLEMDLPQPTDPNTLATPPLREAVIELPDGLVVNPSSANGLAACSLAEVGISAAGQPNSEPLRCPDASKIGTLELQTPLLSGSLGGQIYLARQLENPFDSLLAIYLVINDPRTGVLVKIPGEIQADPQSGQLTAVVPDSPQFPFSHLQTKFFGGPRAALRTPSVCGSYTVGSTLTPWSAPQSGPPATPSSSFPVSSGAGGSACPASEAAEPNRPSFEAGTTTPIAGAYSPFVLKLARADGSQPFGHIDATLPAGLLARIADTPYCPEAAIRSAESRGGLGQGAQEIASPSCPAASEVGTVSVGAGSGSQPFYATGHAYLAGPYKGAPLSLVVITPAVAGPFDLGSVVVRNALYVDETTAQVHAVSDPFPTILHGIPLDIRSVALNLGKPDFTLNPTSCEPKQIVGSATSALGNVAPLTQRFQVGACGALGFKPGLKINLKGGTKRSKFPALTATLTYPKGSYANVRKASVALPHSEFLAQEHIKTICTRVQFAAGAGNGAQCPKGSIYGKATATSPLLDQPLSGPVYLRSSSHPLPDLVVALHGQIDVALVGRIDSVGGGIRTTFAQVPDAPVSKFTLRMQGGKKGLLVNSTNICRSTNRAIAKLNAQNGKTYDTEPVVTAKCGGKAKKGKHGGGAHHR